MKLLILFLSIFPAILFSQQVNLHIHHEWMGNTFTVNTNGATEDGENFKFTLLKYYVSGVTITHDGGMETTIPDFIAIADASEGTSIFNLGTPAVNIIEGIEFFIGVDSARNHDDPSIQPIDAPLSFQSPSMHWGWSSGYRFILLEGLAGANYNQTVQIHTLGDQNYKRTNVAVGAELVAGEKNIHIIGEYQEALNNMAISAGLVNHGFSGEAALLTNNCSNSVFRAGTLSLQESNEAAIAVYPNPTNGLIKIKSTDQIQNYSIIDFTGKTVLNVTNQTLSNEIELAESGIYFLKAITTSGVQIIEKIVVE